MRREEVVLLLIAIGSDQYTVSARNIHVSFHGLITDLRPISIHFAFKYHVAKELEATWFLITSSGSWYQICYSDKKKAFFVQPIPMHVSTCLGSPKSVICTFHVTSWHIFFLLFTTRSIPEPIETHIETSLRSGRNSWENSCRPSQLEIQSLDNLFKGLMKKPLVQFQVGNIMTYVLCLWRKLDRLVLLSEQKWSRLLEKAIYMNMYVIFLNLFLHGFIIMYFTYWIFTWMKGLFCSVVA